MGKTLIYNTDTHLVFDRFLFSCSHYYTVILSLFLLTGPESICYPVQMTTYDSYFLDKYDYEFGLQSVEVFDIGPIHSTDIFKVPKQCMGAPMKEMKNKTALRFLI